MARLQRADGPSVEISLVGYQYPELTPPVDEWDDWLQVRVAVEDGGRTWSSVNPSLLTFEVTGMIHWLREHASAQGGERDTFAAIEPNISFRATADGDRVALAVALALESCPPWTPADSTSEDGHQAWLATFLLTPDALRTVADDLEAEATRFPERGARRHRLVLP